MFAAFPFEKDTPYWRAVPRSEVHELPEPLPTFCEVPVTVSCLGWLVLKITVPAAVVAEAMVFSPVLASCIIQPFAASSAAAALVCVCEPLQLAELCRQPLVMSDRSLSVIAAGKTMLAPVEGVVLPALVSYTVEGELVPTLPSAYRVAVLRSLNM